MTDQGRSIGGLWLRKDKKGKTYLSGSIEIEGQKHQVVVFKNERKQEGERTPDYRIFPQRQREDIERPERNSDDVPF